MRVASVLLLGLLVSLAGCERPSAPEFRATLGVFYGGQVQERLEVPMPGGARRPTLGFRIESDEPTPGDLPVHFEVDQPGRANRRITRVGDTVLRAGQRRLDQVIEAPREMPLGVWNVRVTLGDDLVIDRALSLYDPGVRERRIREIEEAAAE